METKDLRIGNFLSYDKKNVYIAEILKDNRITIYNGNGFEKTLPLECCRPIKLTEKFFMEHKEKLSSYIPIIQIVNIEYIHQLQNIYYSLTGEELIILNEGIHTEEWLSQLNKI